MARLGGRPNLANMWSVNFAFDAEEFEMLLRSDPGKHKDLWRVGDSCRENDLFRRSDRELLAAFIDAHCAHHSVTSEDQFLDFWLRDDGDVGLAVDEDDTRRALALVDGAHALDKAILLAFVDIIGERLALAYPCLGQTRSECLELGHYVVDCDVERSQRTLLADLGELWAVELAVIVIVCALYAHVRMWRLQ